MLNLFKNHAKLNYFVKKQLINDCFPCNVLTKIYVKNTAKNDLKLTLIEIAKKFKIEVEEY